MMDNRKLRFAAIYSNLQTLERAEKQVAREVASMSALRNIRTAYHISSSCGEPGS